MRLTSILALASLAAALPHSPNVRSEAIATADGTPPKKEGDMCNPPGSKCAPDIYCVMLPPQMNACSLVPQLCYGTCIKIKAF